MANMKKSEIEKIEVDLLLDAIYRCHGYDFRNYARASLKRRLNNMVRYAEVNHISELLGKVLRDKVFFDRFLQEMSISVTEMFRDPAYYRALRTKVIKILKTYPFVKIWHAGCSTGEEVYSMAILLHEEKFLGKTQIYATDYNPHSLEIAREGVYLYKDMDQYNQNYIDAGGKLSLEDYYYGKYKSVKIHDFLKENITFAHHNLVTDSSFGEMHLIICRNVLIYFDKKLQARVYNLFSESLVHEGFLCLGTKESLSFSESLPFFESYSSKEKIYRKKSSVAYEKV
jgi:chemotaxis protein methyltransferase CheR